MNALENRIPPPLVTLAIAAAMWLAAPLAPTLQLAISSRLPIAVIFLVFGVACLLQGGWALTAAKTTFNPIQIEKASALVTKGIYNYSRNPMYVGFASLLVGWAVYLASPWLLFGPAIFVAFINRFQITPEERVMSAKFGSDFTTYKSRVRRWL